MTTWRFIDAGARDAPEFFGRMPALALGVAQGGPQVLQTGLFARGHFQIGWFEDVDAVLDLETAERMGVAVFRRPVWGGGTAFYDTNATALFSFFLPDDAFDTLDAALRRFQPVMTSALASVGLGEARIEGSSDIRWNGRKLGTVITQAVLGTKVVGGFLNLRSPDLETYRAIAHVPEEKFKDKAIKDMVAYICTPRDVRGENLAYEELRDAIVRAAEADGLVFEASSFTDDEDRIAGDFVAAVSAQDWVKRISTERFAAAAAPGNRVVAANVKGRKLVRALVEVAPDGTIARAVIAGDMHVSPPDAMDRLSSALAGARPDEVEARAQAIFDQPDVVQPDEAAGITAADVAAAVGKALAGS